MPSKPGLVRIVGVGKCIRQDSMRIGKAIGLKYSEKLCQIFFEYEYGHRYICVFLDDGSDCFLYWGASMEESYVDVQMTIRHILRNGLSRRFDGVFQYGFLGLFMIDVDIFYTEVMRIDVEHTPVDTESHTLLD